MNLGGFSWKRLLGITAMKSKISRQIGIPLTRSGRQRKFGEAAGCATMVVVAIAIMMTVAAFVSR